MSESNRSYRIRTKVGSDNNGSLNIDLNLLQDYDLFEILSLKIDTKNLYKYQTSKYGCVVGRVLANGGVGVPNVKISAFIPIEGVDYNNPVYKYLYPYTSTRDRDSNDIRYNLLTDQKIDSCHQNIGTFPNKRLVLDDSNILEVYDKYYIHTTTTNGSGDYMLFGVPVGNTIIHSDLDLSDIGFLSQKPRDLFYKGYNVNQFENANKFKKDTNLDNLTQVLSQDSSVYVYPFWGDETENEGQIKIVRNDIDVNYKFEPTCIFIGSVVSDERSNGISKRCIPHDRLGKMDRLTTGRGTIEMIRKTLDGDIESISIQGNELIDGNGTWCYQIPMNLDYMTTDEYGNLVATDNYEKGIPTRTRVRFRVSLADYESEGENSHLVKVLVPNIPSMSKMVGSNGYIKTGETTDGKWDIEKVDYVFGSDTQDESFRDLMWNNVYSVKSYIPRIQKGNKQKNKNFTGFKAVNVNNGNNPIPYNNMRINLTFLFTFQCLIFKCVVMIVKFLNKVIYVFDKINCNVCSKGITGSSLVYVTMDGGICPNLNGNYVAPGAKYTSNNTLIVNTYDNIIGDDLKTDDGSVKLTRSTKGTVKPEDKKSSDNKNDGGDTDKMTYEDEEGDVDEKNYFKILNDETYFIKCVELQFALEYEVIQFDFYNDWLNGVIYIPRWFGEMKKLKNQMSYCGMDDDDSKEGKKRNYTQQCALKYDSDYKITSDFGCTEESSSTKQKCHKSQGRKVFRILSGKGKHGLIRAHKDSHGLRAYYLRPYEYSNSKLCNLFSTDIILLGNVNDCNRYGIPKVEGYTSSSYIMPPPTGMLVDETQEMHGEMKKNFRTFLIMTINKVFDEVYNSYSYKECVKIKMGKAGGNGTKTLDEIFYGKSKNGEEDAEYTLGLVFNTNVIFPKVSDLSVDIEVNKITNIIDDIMRVYRKNCYEHIYEKPTFMYDKKDVIGSGIRDEAKCWSPTSNNNSCSNLTLYDHCINYFDYPDPNNNSCSNCSSTNRGITIKDGLLHILTADDFCQPLCHKNGIISGNKGCLKKVGKIENVDNLLAKRIKNRLMLDITERNYENWREKESTEEAKKILYGFSKSIIKSGSYENGELLEISGIDWGYNPFYVDAKDKTDSIPKQAAGHFLEIGCMFSLSNIKSCVNLQRICEIGSEMSQSHVKSSDYFNDITKIHPSGVITKKEISDRGIRSIFATLNSTGLETEYDEETGFFKYKFIPYQPVSFDGGLENKKLNINNNNYKEFKSDSYIDFRFGLKGNNGFKDDRFLIYNGGYYLPQYRNSFYFYFGLKDGSTAIDRLYSEYYATCSD